MEPLTIREIGHVLCAAAGITGILMMLVGSLGLWVGKKRRQRRG